jgi:hypothetical protein
LLVIVQDARSLVAEVIDGADTERVRFAFGGTTRQDVSHANTDVTSTASWKDDTLIVRSTFRMKAEGTILSERDETWSLDSGGRLVIDVTTRRANGQSTTARRLFGRQ